MPTDPIQQLLAYKIQLLTTIANTSMLWWVSAVVFCASVLGAIWSRRSEAEAILRLKPMGFLLYFFFSSIVLYGLLVTIMVALQYRDIRFLLQKLGDPVSSFDVEYLWILIGMPIGTSSFVIFLAVWHFFWQSMKRTLTSEIVPKLVPNKVG